MIIKLKNKVRIIERSLLKKICHVNTFRKGIRQLKMKRFLSFPSDVVIELTNSCNLDCIMCPRRQMKRGIGKMNFDLFMRIIDESVKGGARRILPFLFGEPFIQSDIGRYLSYIRAKSKGINISILTNGLLLNNEKMEILFENKVNAIGVSLDAATQETYIAIRRNKGFQQAEQNIKELLSLRKKRGASIPFIAVQFVAMKDNMHEVEAFRQKWEGIVDSVNFGGYSDMARGVEPFINPSGLKPVPCFRLWNELIICNDGKVALCCKDWDCSITLGDVNNQSLIDIWNSKALHDIRDKHLMHQRGDLSLCSKCYPEEWDSSPSWWY